MHNQSMCTKRLAKSMNRKHLIVVRAASLLKPSAAHERSEISMDQEGVPINRCQGLIGLIHWSSRVFFNHAFEVRWKSGSRTHECPKKHHPLLALQVELPSSKRNIDAKSGRIQSLKANPLGPQSCYGFSPKRVTCAGAYCSTAKCSKFEMVLDPDSFDLVQSNFVTGPVVKLRSSWALMCCNGLSVLDGSTAIDRRSDSKQSNGLVPI